MMADISHHLPRWQWLQERVRPLPKGKHMIIDVVFQSSGQVIGTIEAEAMPQMNQAITVNGLPYEVMRHSNAVTAMPPSARPRIFVRPYRGPTP